MNKNSLLIAFLVGLCLSSYQFSEQDFGNDISGQIASKDVILSEKILITTKCCECNTVNASTISVSNKKEMATFISKKFIHQLAWTLNGKKLGVLSSTPNEKVLHIIEASTQKTTVELKDNITEFAWSVTGEEIFYLRRDETLYRYNLANSEATLLAQGVSKFSVSPDGEWLGVSIREQREDSPFFNYFTFRALNLMNGNLLTTSDRNDFGRIGSNKSAWSPVTNQVAVLFGLSTTQANKVVIYEVQSKKLEIVKSIIAQETYLQDFSEDLRSVEFADMAWSPNKENLLIIRSLSDAQPGGEILLFDAISWNYSRLPFGESVTNLSWSPDGNRLVYTRASSDIPSCQNTLKGEILLVNIHELEPQILITDTLYTVAPIWQP